jgi:hypothetical protein
MFLLKKGSNCFIAIKCWFIDKCGMSWFSQAAAGDLNKFPIKIKPDIFGVQNEKNVFAQPMTLLV